MIAHVLEAEHFPSLPLSVALARPVAEQDVLGEVVVAHSPTEHSYAQGSPQEWMFADWEDHLLEPVSLHPYAGGPNANDPEIFHLAVRLHPTDRALHPPEWTEIAQRLARVTGLTVPGTGQTCRWVALQVQPGRLDVIANLIRSDGVWAHQPHLLHRVLMDECRHIEDDLDLVPAQPRQGRPLTAMLPTARPTLPRAAEDQSPPFVAAQLATLMCQLADEANGPIASVRGVVEQAAYRLEELPHAYGPDAGHRLELIARRLYGIHQDLEATAADLPGANQRAALATHVPAAPRPARRSR
ncbi:relaxase/mobilization nuclease [Streptomyces sp. NPDC059037]|uniref:relaxase/mobilization nuclease n=1 Tax=Streptomyces sp. NPDC059037 TaxID=3346710 RepID=UPI003686F65C